jgi:prefoldin subunit 5
VTLLVVLSLLSGCSRGPSEEELKYTALQEQLSTLQQQYQVLQDARANLVTATATLAERRQGRGI